MEDKKDMPQVINNIGELHLENDYDKLADAIMRAQRQVEKKTDIKDEDVVVEKWNMKAFVKGIWCFICNKNAPNNAVLINFFKYPIIGLFRFISIICLLLLPFVCAFSWRGLVSIQYAWETFWDWAIFAELYVVLPLVLVVLGISTWGAANQFSHETDKIYVLTIFSGTISLIALITTIANIIVGG